MTCAAYGLVIIIPLRDSVPKENALTQVLDHGAPQTAHVVHDDVLGVRQTARSGPQSLPKNEPEMKVIGTRPRAPAAASSREENWHEKKRRRQLWDGAPATIRWYG